MPTPAQALANAVDEAVREYRRTRDVTAFDAAMRHRVPRLLALSPPADRPGLLAWIRRQRALARVPAEKRQRN